MPSFKDAAAALERPKLKDVERGSRPLRLSRGQPSLARADGLFVLMFALGQWRKRVH